MGGVVSGVLLRVRSRARSSDNTDKRNENSSGTSLESTLHKLIKTCYGHKVYKRIGSNVQIGNKQSKSIEVYIVISLSIDLILNSGC